MCMKNACGPRVYHNRINHDRSLRQIYVLVTWRRRSWPNPASVRKGTFGSRRESLSVSIRRQFHLRNRTPGFAPLLPVRQMDILLGLGACFRIHLRAFASKGFAATQNHLSPAAGGTSPQRTGRAAPPALSKLPELLPLLTLGATAAIFKFP
jgi:hypothetical protein